MTSGTGSSSALIFLFPMSLAISSRASPGIAAALAAPGPRPRFRPLPCATAELQLWLLALRQGQCCQHRHPARANPVIEAASAASILFMSRGPSPQRPFFRTYLFLLCRPTLPPDSAVVSAKWSLAAFTQVGATRSVRRAFPEGVSAILRRKGHIGFLSNGVHSDPYAKTDLGGLFQDHPGQQQRRFDSAPLPGWQ